MGETARKNVSELPSPKEVFIDGHRFVKYGISPVKLAELRAGKLTTLTRADADPIMKDGYEYVYNSRGKLVRLEHFDPNTMEEFILTPDARLTEEQERQLAESESRPMSFDEDCPESTPEQLERFRRFGQERNKRRAEMEKAKLGIKQMKD